MDKEEWLDQSGCPVFVFLDEGIPTAQAEIDGLSLKDRCYHIQAIPFPKVFKSLGIFDSQLVLFMKKMIFSKQYDIRHLLYQDPEPIFIFFTNDGNFIEDAKDGFQKLSKPKGAQKGIKFFNDRIVLNDWEKKVTVNVFFIIGDSRDNRAKLVKRMLQALTSFLS